MPGVAQAVDDNLITLTEERVALAAHVSVRRARAWHGLVEPSVVRVVGAHRTVRLYAWQESVELLLVAAFVERNVPTQQIRHVLARLRELGYNRPLRQVEFGVAGRELYYRLDDGGWEGGRQPGQGVIREAIDLELIRARVRDAARPDRRELAGKIERRRGLLGSKPVLAGTRVPVDTVRRYIAAGFDDARILMAFPDLQVDDIRSVRASA